MTGYGQNSAKKTKLVRLYILFAFSQDITIKVNYEDDYKKVLLLNNVIIITIMTLTMTILISIMTIIIVISIIIIML